MKDVTPDQWLYVLAPFLIYGGIVAALSVLGWESSLRANLHRNPLVIFSRASPPGWSGSPATRAGPWPAR
jgi:hypothetical protein